MSEYFKRPVQMTGGPVSLSSGNTILFAITVGAFAIACGLCAYTTNTAMVLKLQQAGFVTWSGSSVWADVLKFPWPNTAPGSSVWYYLLPGKKVNFSFMTLPLLRAVFCALVFSVGGMLCLLVAIRWFKTTPVNKIIVLVLATPFFALSITAALPANPDEFTIDLSQDTITTSFQPDMPLIPFQISGGFYRNTLITGKTSRSYVEAIDTSGHRFDLIALGTRWQANALIDALNSFIASQGNQI